MVEIELNNGETVKAAYNRQKPSALLFQIMDEATDKIGHTPTLEEAKSCPWMPKDLDSYDKYCVSYDIAVRTVMRKRKARSQWRKATPEETKELERLETIKRKREDASKYLPRKPRHASGNSRSAESQLKETTGGEIMEDNREYYATLVADLIIAKETIPTPRQLSEDYDLNYRKMIEVCGSYDKIMKAAREVLAKRGLEIDSFGKVKRRNLPRVNTEKLCLTDKTDIHKNKEVGQMNESKKEEKRRRTTQACKYVLRDFALENKRWPTDAEIAEFSQSKRPDWLSVTEIRKRFGVRNEWPSKIFPEGLPDGFNENNRVQAAASEVAKSGASTKGVVKMTKKAGAEDSQLAKRGSKPKIKPATVPDVESEESKTPRELFFDAIEGLLALANKAGGGEITLSMTAQLAGEKEPAKLDFSINTLKK